MTMKMTPPATPAIISTMLPANTNHQIISNSASIGLHMGHTHTQVSLELHLLYELYEYKTRSRMVQLTKAGNEWKDWTQFFFSMRLLCKRPLISVKTAGCIRFQMYLKNLKTVTMNFSEYNRHVYNLTHTWSVLNTVTQSNYDKKPFAPSVDDNCKKWLINDNQLN